MKSSRRLAAIMFTDIVGYSTMMQQDEKVAMSQAKLHEDVITQHVSQFGGRLQNFYGDGSLSIFESAVEAVKCARDIQIFFQQFDFVPLRIGIHIADVVSEGERVFSDGINIASRIESSGHAGDCSVFR